MPKKKTSYPTAVEKLLLESCLAEQDSQALQAWSKWQKSVDLNQIDISSQRLLPILCQRLMGLGCCDSSINKMKGIHRYIWAKNQARFHSFSLLLKEFRELSIPVLFLKGSALLLSVYQDFGLRDMEDIDFLVPKDRADDALQALRKTGWRAKFTKFRVIRRYTSTFLSMRSSVAFKNFQNEESDLHWAVYTSSENQSSDFSADLWKLSSSLVYRSFSVQIPSAETLLFHVCQHGLDYNEAPSFRWIVDAVFILRKNPAFKWDRIGKFAVETNERYSTSRALLYLKNEFQVLVPDTMLQRLQSSSTLRVEKDCYLQRIEERLKEPPQGNFSLIWWMFIRNQGEKKTRGLLSFFCFVREILGLQSLVFLPFYSLYIAAYYFRVKLQSFSSLTTPESKS